MKRLFSALLTFVLILSLTACGDKGAGAAPEDPEPSQSTETPAPEKAPEKVPEKDPEPAPAPAVVPLRIMKGPIYYDEWDENFNPLISAACEDLALMEDLPALASALYELNTDQSVGAYSFVQEWRPDAKEFLTQHPDFFGGFTFESAYTVQRADSLILSLREDFSSYTGGVHGNYGVWGYSFDTATGERLALEDILTDTEGLDQIIAEKIRAKYSFEPFPSLDETLAEYAPEDYAWTLGYQGITFYFSPYEIASYAAGLLTATVWFDEMPELFREEYMVAPESGYAVGLPNWYDLDVDLHPENAAKDTLSVWEQEGEYGTKHLGIRLNGQEFVDESWSAYYITPCLICLEGEFYLMAEGSSDNDYCTMYIYSLGGSTPNLTAELSGVGFVSHWHPEAGQEGIYYTEIFNDPALVTLGSKCDLLGTKTACRAYTFSPGGALIPLADVYDLDPSLDPILSTVPLDVTLLPHNSVETIPAGTEFYFLRTDNETYVDLMMADGRECRIVIEYRDWTPTINGVPEWDCFENLMYAG